MYDYCIVGAGLFGSVLAERIANDLGARVLLVEKRSHIGGNCYSEVDLETGIEFHKYGTHIFHTDSEQVWKYITKFTRFNGYHHQVLTTYKNKVFQLPINLETINSFFNLNLKPSEARVFLKSQSDGIKDPKNLEEKAIFLMGKSLYESFIKGYTIKQWGKMPRELPSSIITRLPVRYNYQEDYFLNSRWQGIPLNGYTKMFNKMLNSPRIHIKLNCDYFEYKNQIKSKKIFYTGRIDQYFNYVYGKLEWRSIKLRKKIIPLEDYQGTAVMNYAERDIKFTRIHEPRHLHTEREYPRDKTIIFFEYPCSRGCFYPIATERNIKILNRYKSLAKKKRNVFVGGRLGNYAYYDMDKTILNALKCYKEFKSEIKH